MHTAVELLREGYRVLLCDNLSNSSMEAVSRVERITGSKIPFYRFDVTKHEDLNRMFAENEIDAVVHFAGFKAVGESTENPLKYYRNNLDTTLTLLEVMDRHDVRNIVFSSSATVYGIPDKSPITEDMRAGVCFNPYGRSKYMNEQILTDCAAANPSLSVVLLRYFNPIGAHESGLIGDDPSGIPNNLMPYISQVAVGKLRSCMFSETTTGQKTAPVFGTTSMWLIWPEAYRSPPLCENAQRRRDVQSRHRRRLQRP